MKFGKLLLVVLSIYALLFAERAFSAGSLSGIVIDRGNNKSIVGATVGVLETKDLVTTDKNGRFSFYVKGSGKYTIIVSVPGYKKKRITVDNINEKKFLRIYLSQKLVSGDEIVVTARKEKPVISRWTVKREELKRVPGTSGDIMRSIQALPGVATGNDFSGQLYVRGNGPYDNLVLFDRFWLVNVYHFGGFVSVINSDFIDTIDFYSGGFPVIYGEATGAILDITTREKEEPTWGGKVNVNMLTADAVIEAPFTDNGYILLSGRRSYFDLYAEKLIKTFDDVEVSILPYFWDYQGKLGYYFTKKNLIEFVFYGSGDRIGLTVDEDQDIDFANREFNYTILSHGQGFTWKYIPSKRFFSTFKVGSLQQNEKFFFGEYVDVDTSIKGIMAREDMTLNLSRYFAVDIGFSYTYARLNLDGVVPVMNSYASDNPIFPDDYTIEDFTLKKLDYHHYAGYLQNTLTVAHIKWVAGMRYDFHEDVNRFYYFSPRTSIEYSVNKRNRISFATGLYQQAHDMYFTNSDFGNPDLTTQKAIHYVIGYEIDVTSKTTFSLESYYKNLWDLAVSGSEENFDDTGTGSAYGGELLLRRKLADGFFGWLSYGYSVSKRDDHDEKGEYFFDYDRTHILNIIASYKVNQWFQIGIKWRYATGLPYTRIDGSFYSPSKEEHVPLYSTNYNKDRMPDYHKLDIRIDFFTNWFGVKWDLYIEVLNAYNSKNVYSEEFDQREEFSSDNPKDVRDLPILPYFGIEVRF